MQFRPSGRRRWKTMENGFVAAGSVKPDTWCPYRQIPNQELTFGLGGLLVLILRLCFYRL